MEKVRAKFQVQSTKQVSWDPNVRIIELTAVTAGSGKDNESWSKWTPSGRLEMHITNPAASDFFTLGKAVYLDFTEAES